MSTVRDLIKGSLRLIGAIATGETPSANEQADALLVLNEMLDAWSANGLMVYKLTRESFPLIAGQATYTIGPTGNFDTTRPLIIQDATIQVSGLEIPLKLYDFQEYAQIVLKTTGSTVPLTLFRDKSFPLDNLTLWPVPSAASNLILYSLKALTAFASANDTVSLPEGYAQALRYNLAGLLAPEYGKQLDPVIAAIAAESKATIQRKNLQPSHLKSDAFALTDRRRKTLNIYTGE